MRDQLNFNSFNLLPIVKDDRNDLTITTCIKGYAPNISNGYYGFQPAVQNKNERHEREQQQQHERMDVTENEIQRPLNCCRKRAWNCENDVDFKRRRENDVVDSRGYYKMKKKEDVKFLEELLKETHGGDLYNYWTGDDV